jgi:hypothetical protein
VMITSSANAQAIVYDHGGVLPSWPAGTDISIRTVAVKFNFATSMTFDGIRFWDAEAYTGSRHYSGNGFNWFIYTDNAGLPASILASGTTTPLRQALGPLPAFDGDYFQNDLSIGSMTLAGGTYWLGLRDNWAIDSFDPSLAANIVWDAAQPRAGFTYQPGVLQRYGTNVWEQDYFDHAYQLTQSTTVTPEPASLVLVASGLLGVLGITRRRARRAD